MSESPFPEPPPHPTLPTSPARVLRPGRILAALSALAVGAVAVASVSAPSAERVDVATDPTSTSREPTTTGEHLATTSTLAEAPEGGTRSGTGDDLPADDAASGAGSKGLSASSNESLRLLAELTVLAERPRSGYERELFSHWDDVDRDGCDTRCEVLVMQRLSDGTWLSEWDGYRTTDTTELHVDHVVALAEAWDSGADAWGSARRDEFANDLPNLLAVTAASNLRKSDKDPAEWFPSRSAANCLWASTVVRVKDRWDLAVDPAESEALGNLLRTCDDYVAPTTTAPARQPASAPPPAPGSGCTPGYSPCIPPGDDVDCSGGGGNGPRYVEGPVSVEHAHGDPYDLDRDGDGVGCQ